MDALMLRFCRLLKRIMLFVMRNPSLPADSETVRRLQRQRHAEPEEFREYQETWTRGHWSSVLICVWSLAIMAKYSLIVFRLINSADHKNPENNLVPANESSQYRFHCLATNCSEPFGGPSSLGLGHDLNRLPHLWLCRPELTQSGLYSPLDMLNAATLLNNGILVLISLVMGVALPLTYAALGLPHELIMFTVAPKLTGRLVCDRLIGYRRDLAASYLNFRALATGLGGPDKREPQKLGQFLKRPKGAHQLKSAHLAAASAERLDKYARDTLPVVRSGWWCKRMQRLSFGIFIFITLFSILSLGLFVLVNLLLASRHGSRLAEFELEMRRQRCAIWQHDNHNHDQEPVDIKKPLAIGYSYYVLLERGSGVLILMLTSASILTNYLVLIAELNFWLQELHAKLVVAIEMLSLESALCAPAATSKPPYLSRDLSRGRREGPEFRMAEVGERIIRLAQRNRLGYLRFSHGDLARSSLPGARGRTDTSIGQQLQALELLAGHQPGASVDCVEKVYLSFRLFMGAVRQYGQVLAPIIFLSHSLTYLLATMTVYFARNVGELSYEPAAAAAGVVVLVAIFINFGAAFHARATRLVPLVWSLVARITEDGRREPRLEHLRLLWLKLADMVAGEGGIYLEAMGVSFNYLNIVQLTIGTGTIMILAMKD